MGSTWRVFWFLLPCYLITTFSRADKVTEYFEFGKYQDGERLWSMVAYDGTVEATFDDAGENVGANRYSAFGERISDVGQAENRKAFHGGELRENLNYYNLGARTMEAGSGNWLQPEPLVIDGLDAKRLQDPLQFSPYRYARNNPEVLTDPDGFAVLPVYSTKLDRLIYAGEAMLCLGAYQNMENSLGLADRLNEQGEWLLAAPFQINALGLAGQMALVCPDPNYQRWLTERRVSQVTQFAMPVSFPGSAASVSSLNALYQKMFQLEARQAGRWLYPVGTRSLYGTVVSRPALTIRSFSTHVLERMMERNISQEVLSDTLEHPLLIVMQSNSRYTFLSKECAAVVAPDGVIVTVMTREMFDETYGQALNTVTSLGAR